MNKLGVHALVWVGGWSHSDCDRAISSTAELGYDFIEVPLLEPFSTDVAYTAKSLKSAGIGATASLGLDADTDISSEDDAVVARGEALLNQALSVVRDIGGTDLCGVIHSAMMKYMAPKTAREVENSVSVLRRLAQKADAAGVKLHLEVVNRYESNLLNTGAQAVEMIGRIGAPNLRVHLDTYHMNIEEGFVGRAIEDCGKHLGYFHVGESHRGYLGTGTIDFDAAFRALARIGYAGPIAFESFSSAVVDPKLSNMLGVWRNLWSDSHDLARHAKGFMEAHLLAARKAATLAPTLPA